MDTAKRERQHRRRNHMGNVNIFDCIFPGHDISNNTPSLFDSALEDISAYIDNGCNIDTISASTYGSPGDDDSAPPMLKWVNTLSQYAYAYYSNAIKNLTTVKYVL